MGDRLKAVIGTLAWAAATGWLVYSATCRPGLSDYDRGGFAGAALVFGIILVLWLLGLVWSFLWR